MNCKLNLTQYDSNVLKGIALLLLLLHHLFYQKTGLFDDAQLYKNIYIVNYLGQFGKLCVAIFVFLSGYGLTIQANKSTRIQLCDFYKRRFTKLYLNYWLIWILFVPIGIFFFNRTLDIVYINHIYERLLIDVFGLSFAFGFYGYNATWWFYSCIIILYVLFPFLYKLLGKFDGVLFILGLSIYIFNFPIFRAINQYFISFIVGMIMANGIKINFLSYKIINKYLLIILFVLGCSCRNLLCNYAILLDAFICVIGTILFKQISLWSPVANFLAFIGKHSMNIFLFHTFIYLYYLKEYVFFSRNPLVIYLTLLMLCLLISISLENIKKIIGFYKIKL